MRCRKNMCLEIQEPEKRIINLRVCTHLLFLKITFGVTIWYVETQILQLKIHMFLSVLYMLLCWKIWSYFINQRTQRVFRILKVNLMVHIYAGILFLIKIFLLIIYVHFFCMNILENCELQNLSLSFSSMPSQQGQFLRIQSSVLTKHHLANCKIHAGTHCA